MNGVQYISLLGTDNKGYSSFCSSGKGAETAGSVASAGKSSSGVGAETAGSVASAGSSSGSSSSSGSFSAVG